MAGLDTLNITNSGFFNINKKIIGNKVFSDKLIVIHGETIITDGIASSFSEENYLSYSPLLFYNAEKISVNFQGTFTKADNKQCIWELITPDGDVLTLTFENSRVALSFGSRSVFALGNIELTDDMALSSILTLKGTSYEFTLNYGKNVVQKSGTLGFIIPINSFRTINIGNSTIHREAVWAGSVNLKEFTIYNNNTLLYTPSIGTPWNFTYILVSDGSKPLTDDLEPTLDHIFKFPVSEISRSGNSVLLTCVIDENAFLTIREIGLYIEIDEKPVLFGYINNLNVNKKKGLAYDLIFTVNTTISVVNVVGFPAENGIVVDDPDFVEFKDYTTIQQVNTYVLTNLERMIRMNAGAKGSYINSSVENNQAGIGHNRPQVIYELQEELELEEDCYNSVDTFTKLINKFRKITGTQINYDTITIHGNLNIDEGGNASGFSSENYITAPTEFRSTDSWGINLGFTTQKKSKGTILSLENSSSFSPMELTIEDGKCHLKIQSMESIQPSNLNSYYVRNAASDTVDTEPTYYSWLRTSLVPMYNFHCSGFNVSNSSIISFPQNEVVQIEHENVDSSKFSFSIRVAFNSAAGTQYVVGAPSASESSFEILLENGKLKANLFKASDKSLINSNLISKFNLKPGKYYDISLSYNGSTYTLQYSAVVPKGEYSEGETITFESEELIDIGNSNNLVLGRRGISSTFGLLWNTPVKTSFMNNDTWVGAACSTSKYSAICERGYTVYSNDGITWNPGGTITVLNGAVTWKAITYGNNKFIALSSNGYISTSNDGEAWYIASENANLAIQDIAWRALAYSGSKFVALDENGYVSTSTDGETWLTPSLVTNLSSHPWKALAYGDGKFIALSSDSYISTSTDGATWSEATLIESDINSWAAITFFDNKFIIISSDGYLSTSANGTTWTTPVETSDTLLSEAQWNALTSNGKIAIIDINGYTSSYPGGILEGKVDFFNMSLIDDTYKWRGSAELDSVLTLSKEPSNGDNLYDKESYLVQGSVSNNYSHSAIIDTDLFEAHENTKYTLNISYSEDILAQKSTYKVTRITNDKVTSEETILLQTLDIESNLSNRMSIPETTYVGINKDLINAYSSILNLFDWRGYEENEAAWSFSHIIPINNTELLQYYRTPDLYKNQYAARDLCNLDRKIRFLSNKFEGNEDVIDFTVEEGLTLCVKVNLTDAEPKILLCKSNLVSDFYFALTFLEQTLRFTMVSVDGSQASVSKEVSLEEMDSFTNEPITLTIFLKPQSGNWRYLQMYKNNEPITEENYIELDTTVDPTIFVLSNYIENMPTYEVDDGRGGTITKTVEPGRYVSDIAVIKGIITDRDLFYINNLFDTNY